jgi:hypothetical protein
MKQKKSKTRNSDGNKHKKSLLTIFYRPRNKKTECNKQVQKRTIVRDNKLTSEKVIGQSLNTVAGFIGYPETYLKIYLESKGFEIETKQKFTKEMWEKTAKFLIDNFEEKRLNSAKRSTLVHDERTCTKPNYFKLILTGRSAK